MQRYVEKAMGISSWRSKRQSNTLPRNWARERAIGAKQYADFACCLALFF
nr:MAG TPA: hypothetical protein [Caudoviricetes sp.]